MIVRGNFMKHQYLIQWMGMVLLVALISGCATERGVFNYGIPPALETNRPMWPSPETGEALVDSPDLDDASTPPVS